MSKSDAMGEALKRHKAKLGSGERFHDLEKHVESEGYSEDSAKAIAASAGRKAHGQAQMTKYSKMGKK